MPSWLDCRCLRSPTAKGEVASQLAIDTLAQHTAAVSHATTAREAVSAMEAAVLAANRAVHDAQLADETLRGMATTITAAVLRDGGEVVIGHVGDSRLYVVSAAGARLATDDHSVVAELVRTGRLDPADAAHHPQRNVITRALGPEPDVAVDAFAIHVGPGDWLLVCSDGLTEHVEAVELARALLEHGSADPDGAVRRLVDQANVRGGTDNITLAVAQPVPSDVSGELHVEALQAALSATATLTAVPAGDAPPAEASGPLPRIDAPRAVETSGEIPMLEPLPVDAKPWTDPVSGIDPPRRVRTTAFIAAAVLVAAGIGAFMWSQSYFVVERGDGIVGANRGFPVWRLSAPYRSSDVLASELSGSDRERLVESHRILSRADVDRVLDQLPERVESDDPLEDTGAADPASP